jgi:uncharacterized protein (TIGR03663 family)
MHETAETHRERIAGIALLICALLLGGWLRFHDIGLKPFHHDEGVNSYFLLNLAHSGQYVYDKDNYHGPTLYYLTLLPLWILGERDLALRFWPAAFGVLSITVLWWLKRELGWLGAAIAGLLIAASPGLVYFSRDFIHEMSFVFFALATVVSAWRYFETHKFVYIATLASSLGLLVATKETAVITITVLLLALLCAVVWDRARQLAVSRNLTIRSLASSLVEEIRDLRMPLDHIVAAISIFIVIFVLFYSSFFTNPRGVIDAFSSVVHWSRRSGNEHVHAFAYYFGILLKLELPLLVGGVIAGITVAIKGSRFGLFAAAWTLGSFLSYSLIPYKTPWLIVNILVPLAIVTAYGASELLRSLPLISLKLIWAGICLTGAILSLQMAVRVNFHQYDDNDNSAGYLTTLGKQRKVTAYTDTQYGYVYAQTDRDIFRLVSAIDDISKQLGTGVQTSMFLSSDQYWPLPWYLRKYEHVAYTGSLPDMTQPGAIAQPVLIGNETQRAEIERAPGWKAVTEPIALRPGERLMLFSKDRPPNQ